MKNKRRNRNSIKGSENESRRGTNRNQAHQDYQKLPDNPRNLTDTPISTVGNTANPKYSRTSVRKEEKERLPNSDRRLE